MLLTGGTRRGMDGYAHPWLEDDVLCLCLGLWSDESVGNKLL